MLRHFNSFDPTCRVWDTTCPPPENIVKHCDDGVGSVVANHRNGSESLVVVINTRCTKWDHRGVLTKNSAKTVHVSALHPNSGKQLNIGRQNFYA